MAATVVSRTTWTDDSGSPTAPAGDGTIINNDALQAVYDRVDALSTSNYRREVTWNTTTSTQILDDADVTDTTSDANSLLIRRSVGGASKFEVTKSGLESVLAMKITGEITSTLSSGNANNLAPTGWSSAGYLLRLTPSTNTSTLTGLAGGVTGRLLAICRTTDVSSSGTLTIARASTDSSTGNRFAMSVPSVTLNIGGGLITGVYDGTAGVWQLSE